jgi:hypothetical protein
MSLQCPRPFAERVGVGQQTAAPPQQILAFRCEQRSPTDTVEEGHAELGLQGVDLA